MRANLAILPVTRIAHIFSHQLFLFFNREYTLWSVIFFLFRVTIGAKIFPLSCLLRGAKFIIIYYFPLNNYIFYIYWLRNFISAVKKYKLPFTNGKHKCLYKLTVLDKTYLIFSFCIYRVIETTKFYSTNLSINHCEKEHLYFAPNLF